MGQDRRGGRRLPRKEPKAKRLRSQRTLALHMERINLLSAGGRDKARLGEGQTRVDQQDEKVKPRRLVLETTGSRDDWRDDCNAMRGRVDRLQRNAGTS